MKIVELLKEDAQKISEVFVASFSDGWTEKMIVDGFNGGLLNAFGVQENNRLIGVITFSKGLESIDIEDVAVLPERRRKGVASSLIEAVKTSAKESGIKKILLEVRSSNEGAIALYQTQGFGKISTRKKYYKNGEDAIVMLKEL